MSAAPAIARVGWWRAARQGDHTADGLHHGWAPPHAGPPPPPQKKHKSPGSPTLSSSSMDCVMRVVLPGCPGVRSVTWRGGGGLVSEGGPVLPEDQLGLPAGGAVPYQSPAMRTAPRPLGGGGGAGGGREATLTAAAGTGENPHRTLNLPTRTARPSHTAAPPALPQEQSPRQCSSPVLACWRWHRGGGPALGPAGCAVGPLHGWHYPPGRRLQASGALLHGRRRRHGTLRWRRQAACGVSNTGQRCGARV